MHYNKMDYKDLIAAHKLQDNFVMSWTSIPKADPIHQVEKAETEGWEFMAWASQ